MPLLQPIAVLVEEGTDVKAFENFTLEDAGGEAPASSPPKEEKNVEESSKAASAPTPTPAPEPENTKSSGRLQNALDREPNAEPAAKRLANEKGIKLDGVKG